MNRRGFFGLLLAPLAGLPFLRRGDVTFDGPARTGMLPSPTDFPVERTSGFCQTTAYGADPCWTASWTEDGINWHTLNCRCVIEPVEIKDLSGNGRDLTITRS